MKDAFFALLAISLVLFGLQLNTEYFALVASTKANLATKVSFWIIEIGWITLLFIVLFFKGFLYRQRKKLLLMVCGVFLGIFVLEIAVRIVDPRPPKFTPHHYLNYIGTPNYRSSDGLNIHNSLGYRGSEIAVPKPKGLYRIAILGGSSVYEVYVKDWRQDFARQLEKELRNRYNYEGIEVINAGLPGWDSWEDLINFEFRVLDLEPDLVIVYEGTNDVHARFVTPDSYKSDNSGRKRQWERKLCIDLLCLKIVQRITGFDPYNFAVDAPTAAYTQSNDYNSILGTTPLETLERNKPIYFERNIRNLIAIAKESDIDVLLATWAHSNQFNDYAASVHYEKGFEENNATVKNVGRMKQIPVYDFAKDMPMDKKYWVDGRHNNEKGVSLKAKLFARYITDNKLIDEKLAPLKK